MKGMRWFTLLAVAGCALFVISGSAVGAAGSDKPIASDSTAVAGTLVFSNTGVKAGVAVGAPTTAIVPGDKVAPGEVGTDAPKLYQIRSATYANPTGGQTHGTVFCPSGTVAWGGGGFGSSTSLFQNINSSYPIVSGGLSIGWAVDMNNASGSASSFTVYAVCAKKPRNGYGIFAASFTDSAFSQTHGSVACGLGSNSRVGRPLGGGAFGSSASTSQNINSSYPFGAVGGGWAVDENNATSFTLSHTVYVVCGRRRGWTHVVGSAVTQSAFSQTFAGASCPFGSNVVGGGGFSSSASTAVNMNSTYPFSSTGWGVYENNNTSGNPSITAHAICVT
jgi:hypothetical protein